MNVVNHIFKAYDIRGLVGSELSVNLAYNIGRAYATLLLQEKANIADKKVVVGHDMRPTSEEYEAAVIRGLTESGISVVSIGLVSTPLFNFVCTNSPCLGGINVTASHNPAEYNGFKIIRANGLGVPTSTIRDLIIAEQFESTSAHGVVTSSDPYPEYQKAVLDRIDASVLRPLKVVVDFGNGMGSLTLTKLLSTLPFKMVYLYDTLDGTFPHHEANPLKVETLRDLQKKVLETKADFGFAFDGDGDRIGLVDETGTVVGASFVGALVGLEVLRRHPKSLLLYDLRSSRIVPEVWEAAGARSEMTKVGYVNIRQKMLDTKAAFASELSLHLYFGDLGNVEISDLSFLYVAERLSRENKKLSELLRPLQKYFHSGEINFTIADKDAALEKIEKKYAPLAKKVSHLDGIWLQFDWGWLNVRCSNTEPLVRLNLEATTEQVMKEKVAELTELLKV